MYVQLVPEIKHLLATDTEKDPTLPSLMPSVALRSLLDRPEKKDFSMIKFGSMYMASFSAVTWNKMPLDAFISDRSTSALSWKASAPEEEDGSETIVTLRK